MSGRKAEIAAAEAQGATVVAEGKALLLRHEQRRADLLSLPDCAERAQLLAVIDNEIADVSERLGIAESVMRSLGGLAVRIQNTGRPKGAFDPANDYLLKRGAELHAGGLRWKEVAEQLVAEITRAHEPELHLEGLGLDDEAKDKATKKLQALTVEQVLKALDR